MPGDFFPLRLGQELAPGAEVAAVSPSSFSKAERSLPAAANRDPHLRPRVEESHSRPEAVLEPGPVKPLVSCDPRHVRGPSRPAEPSPAGGTKMQTMLRRLTLQTRPQMTSPQGPRRTRAGVQSSARGASDAGPWGEGVNPQAARPGCPSARRPRGRAPSKDLTAGVGLAGGGRGCEPACGAPSGQQALSLQTYAGRRRCT